MCLTVQWPKLEVSPAVHLNSSSAFQVNIFLIEANSQTQIAFERGFGA